MEQQVSHYMMRRRLGRGGMGEVYEAVDLDLDRVVALKFIAPEFAADPETIRRFETEARSAAALNHPNIATLFAFERDGDRRFIVMELVPGERLSDRIRGGPLAIAEALAVARDVAGALAFAHRRSIVHRDIKPDNLMFGEHGTIKIMDFGLARALLASRLTMTGTSLGTPAYMAPEAMGNPAGPPADVFALGVVLYEMLTGRQPFQGDNPLSIMYSITNLEPTPIHELRPEVPGPVVDLVGRMMLKDPNLRPDASSVAAELAALTGIAAPVWESVASPTSDTVPISSDGTSTARAPRRGAWILGGAGTVLVLALVGIGLATARSRAQREAVILNNQGLRALQAGDLIGAQQRFAQALDKNSKYGQAIVNLGSVYLLRGQSDSAAAYFSNAIATQRNDRQILADAYYNLGSIDLQGESWESAVANLKHSFELDSTNARVYNNSGFALVMAGRATEALALLERGLGRFPNVPTLHKNAGLAAFQSHRDDDAERHLDRAIEADPKLTTAWGLRARVRARRGNAAGAATDLREFMAMHPEAAESGAVVLDLRARGISPSP